MKRVQVLLTAAALAFAPLAATIPSAQAEVIYVHRGPPPLRHEIIVRRPGPDFEWQAGFWRWDGRDYIWVPGHWEPRHGRHGWVPGHWAHRHGDWFWVEGHWRR